VYNSRQQARKVLGHSPDKRSNARKMESQHTIAMKMVNLCKPRHHRDFIPVKFGDEAESKEDEITKGLC